MTTPGSVERVTTPGSVERHDSTTSSGSGMETPDSQVCSLVYKYFNQRMSALHTKYHFFGIEAMPIPLLFCARLL